MDLHPGEQVVFEGHPSRERMLRVGTVDFDTAGSDDSEFRFVEIADPARVVDAVDRAQRGGVPAGSGAA